MTTCHELECLLDYKHACANGLQCHVPFPDLEDAIALGERPGLELAQRLIREGSIPPGEPNEIIVLQFKHLARSMREQNLSIRKLSQVVDASRGTLNRMFRDHPPGIKSRVMASVAAHLGVPLFAVQPPTTSASEDKTVRSNPDHSHTSRPDVHRRRKRQPAKRQDQHHTHKRIPEQPESAPTKLQDHSYDWVPGEQPTANRQHPQDQQQRAHSGNPHSQHPETGVQDTEDAYTYMYHHAQRDSPPSSASAQTEQTAQSEQSTYFRMSRENRRLTRELSQSQREVGALHEQIEQVQKDATRDKLYIAGGAIMGGVVSSVVHNHVGQSREGAVISGAIALSCIAGGSALKSHNRSVSTGLQVAGATMLLSYAGMWAYNRWKRMRGNPQPVESTSPGEEAAPGASIEGERTDRASIEGQSNTDKITATAGNTAEAPKEKRSERDDPPERKRWPGDPHPGIDLSPQAVWPYMPALWTCETVPQYYLFGWHYWHNVELAYWRAGFGGDAESSSTCNDLPGTGGAKVY